MNHILTALILIFTFVFSGCSLNLGEDEATNTNNTSQCDSDQRGEYGECAIFEDIYLTNGIWVVYDGSGTSGSVDMELRFYSYGEVKYCTTNCENFENYQPSPWEWRKSDSNLTFYDSNLPNTIEKQFTFIENNTTNNYLLFTNETNATKTFKNF